MGKYGSLIPAVIYIVSFVVSEDVCQFETFKASCQQNEVIAMTSVHYGIMSRGRCIKKDFGFVGCFTDVLTVAHRRCSGKQYCEIAVPDAEMGERSTGCPQELNQYLSANYTCQKVLKPKDKCYQSEQTILTGSGNISSFVSRTTSCGTTTSPFVIEGKQGQHIDVYLWDFSGASTAGLSIGDTISITEPEVRDCKHGHVYVIVKDVVAPESIRVVTICGGKGIPGTFTKVMTSLGHRLEVRIPGRTASDMEFILNYEVKGCPDIHVGKQGMWERKGAKAVISCLQHDVKWEVQCNGSHWKGDYQNCTTGLLLKDPGTQAVSGMHYGGLLDMSRATAVVLVCSIAFVVGIFIVVVGIIILRRRQIYGGIHREQSHRYSYPQHGGKLPKETQYQMTLQNQQKSHLHPGGEPNLVYNKDSRRCPRNNHQEDRISREHEYAYVDEVIISNINPAASKLAKGGTSLQVPPAKGQQQEEAVPPTAHPQGVLPPPLPPPLPAENTGSPLRRLGGPPPPNQPSPAVVQDTVSLPDFEHLTQNYSYSTLDSRNFSALERESQRNREGLRDQDNEARYS